MAGTPDSPTPEAFDAFAIFGLERALTIDDSELESTWKELSRAHHPDQENGDTDRSATVNRAYDTLRFPSRRLRHWLELQDVTIGRQAAIEPALMDLFAQIGPQLQEADDVLRKRKAASSTLVRALLAEPEMAIQQQLQRLLAQLQRELATTLERFPELEASLPSGDPADSLAVLTRLGFLEKWQQQVQERLMNLIAG